MSPGRKASGAGAAGIRRNRRRERNRSPGSPACGRRAGPSFRPGPGPPSCASRRPERSSGPGRPGAGNTGNRTGPCRDRRLCAAASGPIRCPSRPGHNARWPGPRRPSRSARRRSGPNLTKRLQRRQGLGVRPRRYSETKSSMTARCERPPEIGREEGHAQRRGDGARVPAGPGPAAAGAAPPPRSGRRADGTGPWSSRRPRVPLRASRAAATEESTPPLMATATAPGAGRHSIRGMGCAIIVLSGQSHCNMAREKTHENSAFWDRRHRRF